MLCRDNYKYFTGELVPLESVNRGFSAGLSEQLPERLGTCLETILISGTEITQFQFKGYFIQQLFIVTKKYEEFT